jgi:flagellin-like hook-associated protein FlgL
LYILKTPTAALQDIETLKQRLRELAVRPVEGGEGQSSDSQWEEELTAAVHKLDKRLMQHESAVAAKIDEPLKTSIVE